MLKKTSIGFLLSLAMVLSPFSQLFPQVQHALAIGSASFYNPILADGADPWITLYNGYYYYTQTTGNNITVWKSQTIDGLAKAAKVIVWTPPPTGGTCCDIWAPELQLVNGKWYIYFAADDGNNANHRMYVLQANTSNPQGNYSLKARLSDPNNDTWAIDPTILQKSNGSLYLAYSGSDTAGVAPQKLYIAPMSSPLKVSGSRVLLSSPTYPWETSSAAINEAPEVLQRNNTIFILYNANASWTDNYAVGMLTNTDGNVLNAASWTKSANPVFANANNVYGPGLGTFVKSPDGTEDWLIYHAAKSSGSGWSRNIRTQKYTWNADGTPNLGVPVPQGISYTTPSGEPVTCATCNTYFSWGSSLSQFPVVGTWNLTSSTSANNTTLGSGWNQVFRGSSLTNYTLQTQLQWKQSGTTSSYPKYGVYATYQDQNNYVAAFFDKQYGVLATAGMVGGVDQGWQNSSLAIDFTQSHTLKVVKTNNTFDFYVDGVLMQSRVFTISSGQVGLVTEDTLANYQNISVTSF